MRRIIFSPVLYHALRWAVAAVFVAAAVGKLWDVRAFETTIGDFGLVWPPLVPAAAWALIAAESLAGVGLALNVRGSLAAVTGLLLLFLAVLGYGLWRGLDIECGCLGVEAGWLGSGDLKGAFWRDAAIVACCAWMFAYRRFAPRTPSVKEGATTETIITTETRRHGGTEKKKGNANHR